jgi:hypothetical protein
LETGKNILLLRCIEGLFLGNSFCSSVTILIELCKLHFHEACVLVDLLKSKIVSLQWFLCSLYIKDTTKKISSFYALSQNFQKRLIYLTSISVYPSDRLSTWNNSTPNGVIFTKFPS